MKRLLVLMTLLLFIAAPVFAQHAAVQSHGINVTWTLSATPGVTSQLLCRSTVSGGEDCSNPLQTFADDTTVAFLDTTGVGGTKYYYVLGACVAGICSAPSPEASAVYPIVPASQTGVAASPQ